MVIEAPVLTVNAFFVLHSVSPSENPISALCSVVPSEIEIVPLFTDPPYVFNET